MPEERAALFAACEQGSEEACKQLSRSLGLMLDPLIVVPCLAVIVLVTWLIFRRAPSPTLDLPPAKLGRRVVSVFAEVMIPAFAFVAAGRLLDTDLALYVVVFSVIMIVHWTYTVASHALFGQNLGKWIAGIKVVRTDGRAISWRESMLRSGPEIVLGIASQAVRMAAIAVSWDRLQAASSHRSTLILALLPDAWRYLFDVQTAWFYSELVVILFNARRRALHDFIAGTVVVVKKEWQALRT